MFETIKAFVGGLKRGEVAVFFIIVIVSLVSFFLGRLSSFSDEGGARCVIYPKETVSLHEGGGGEGQVKSMGNFVASINGARYYPIGCSAANRISEENKVWFETREEAEEMGYTPATQCAF